MTYEFQRAFEKARRGSFFTFSTDTRRGRVFRVLLPVLYIGLWIFLECLVSWNDSAGTAIMFAFVFGPLVGYFVFEIIHWALYGDTKWL